MLAGDVAAGVLLIFPPFFDTVFFDSGRRDSKLRSRTFVT